MGMERVDMEEFKKSFKSLKNGCKIPKTFVETGFEIKMHSSQSML